MISEADLTNNGISVVGTLPSKIPIVNYPEIFPSDCNSLLKKHLSHTLWSDLKRKTTSKGGTI